MDRGFMEHYFDVTFNDAIGEIAGNDERYAELQSVADEAVHTLAAVSYTHLTLPTNIVV